MADSTLVNSAQNTQVDTIQVFFTALPSNAGGSGVRIKAFTASNDSNNASVTYKGYIYDSTGTQVSGRAVIPQTIVVKDKFDLGPSAITQLIPPGGSLRMESSTADALTFRVTGLEL